MIYFAGWKEHYSIYPATRRILDTFASELTGHHVSKGTIRFPLTEPVPDKLIERIAKLRTEETAAPKPSKPKRTPSKPGVAKAGARTSAAAKRSPPRKPKKRAAPKK